MSELEGRAIAVTGATGFIGRYLVRALVERGARAIAVVRSPEKAADMVDVEVRKADLTDVDSLAAAFEGCDAIVSNAGVVSIGGQSREALMAANAEGTRNVMEAVRRAGVKRVLMTSSTSVYHRKRRGAYVEDDALWAETDRVSRFLYYAQSKAVAEREAWRLAEEYGLELSVARPSGVYGARDRTGFTSWLVRFTRIPLLTVFPVGLHIPNVYAGDLAEAMMRMLERPASIGRAYNLAGDPEVSFWDMLRAYERAGGSTPTLVLPMPMPMRFAYSLERAAADLDFENRPPEEGFRDMFALDAR